MHIYIGADHRGFEMKSEIVEWLKSLGQGERVFVDVGADVLDPEDDYNDFAKGVARGVLSHSVSPDRTIGVLVCGSGQGMCMQANRFTGIRAALCRTAAEAAEARSHNDANVVCIPADEAVDYEAIVTAFLDTEFSGLERYVRRNVKLDEE